MSIGVDLDGVFHGYRKGWHDGSIYDDPVPGAVEGVKELMKRDAVFIFTARTNLEAVATWLRGLGFQARVDHYPRVREFWNDRNVLLVTNHKYAAKYYVDDHAIRFTTWERVLRDTAPETSDSPHVQDRAAYVRFGTEAEFVADSVREHESVILDVDENGYLIGVEILDPPGTPWIERPPGMRSSADVEDACHADIAARLLAELRETRRMVAQWLYNADSGLGSDTGDLRYAFDSTGRTLDPEMDMIEEEEGQEASA